MRDLGSARLITSSVTAEVSPEAASGIAGDLVGQLAEQVGLGNSTIHLLADGSVFGQTLEASLRSAGYAVITDHKADKANSIPLAYHRQLQASVLARLSTPSPVLTRMDRLDAAGATPTSPFSIIQRSSGSPVTLR